MDKQREAALIQEIDALRGELKSYQSREAEWERANQNRQPTDSSKPKQTEEKLQTKEQIYQALIENMDEVVSLVDGDGILLYHNPSYSQLLGFNEEELTGQNALNQVHPEDRTRLQALFREILQKPGRVVIPPTRFSHKDGSYHWIEGKANYLKTGASMHAVVVNFHDITERKQAEEALRESEQKYRLLVDNATEAIVIAQEGIMVFVNHMACDLSGYSEQELISQPFSEFLHPDDQSMVIENYLKRLKGDMAQSRYVFRFIAHDGSIKWVEIDAVLIDWKGKPATLNFLKDISARKRSEEALRESEANYRTLVENIPQIIFMKDREFKYQSVNKNYARNLGIQIADIVGKTDYELYPKERADKYRAVDLSIMETGQTEELEEKHMQEGRETWAHSIKAPVRDENGEIVAILGVFWDITESKLAEMRLHKQLDELRLWRQSTLGRETRILDLKGEVNELLVKAGQPLRYPSAETENHQE